MTTSERIDSLAASMRLAKFDLNEIFRDKNDITPCSAVELYLEKQLQIRVEKQNLLRRKRADLPFEKTLEGFDFGFQRSVTKEQMLRLADMTCEIINTAADVDKPLCKGVFINKIYVLPSISVKPKAAEPFCVK